MLLFEKRPLARLDYCDAVWRLAGGCRVKVQTQRQKVRKRGRLAEEIFAAERGSTYVAIVWDGEVQWVSGRDVKDILGLRREERMEGWRRGSWGEFLISG